MEWIQQTRLILYVAVFFLVFLLQVAWLIYFTAIRPKQYKKFADFIECSFLEQSTSDITSDCSVDRIVNAGFWGFSALVFTLVGALVSLIMLARKEPFIFIWHLIRYQRLLITHHLWSKYVDGIDRSIGSEEIVQGNSSAHLMSSTGGFHGVRIDKKRQKRNLTATLTSVRSSSRSTEDIVESPRTLSKSDLVISFFFFSKFAI